MKCSDDKKPVIIQESLNLPLPIASAPDLPTDSEDPSIDSRIQEDKDAPD
jgi:hypothetical protein